MIFSQFINVNMSEDLACMIYEKYITSILPKCNSMYANGQHGFMIYLNKQLKFNKYSVYLSAINDHIDTVIALLNVGAKVHKHTIHVLVSKGNCRMTELLFGCGALAGERILYLAILNDDLNMIRLLMNLGFTLNRLDSIHAARSGNNKALMYMYNLKLPITPGVISDAALNGHIETIKLLLSLGMDINDPDIIDRALESNNFDTIKLVLDCGAKPNIDSLYFYMSRYHDRKIINLLLRYNDVTIPYDIPITNNRIEGRFNPEAIEILMELRSKK